MHKMIRYKTYLLIYCANDYGNNDEDEEEEEFVKNCIAPIF